MDPTAGTVTGMLTGTASLGFPGIQGGAVRSLSSSGNALVNFRPNQFPSGLSTLARLAGVTAMSWENPVTGIAVRPEWSVS